MEEDCIPADTVFAQQVNANGSDAKSRFSTHPPVLEDLKRKAKSLGLWNLFLPKAHFKEGAGFSNLEYGLMAELLGKSDIAPEVCPETTFCLGIRRIWRFHAMCCHNLHDPRCFY